MAVNKITVYIVIGLLYNTLEYMKATRDKRKLPRLKREARELECETIFTETVEV